MTTATPLRTLLDTRFGGIIRSGRHDENGQCCALELVSAYRQIPWTDSPSETGMPDLRRMNDEFTTDEARTAAMLPLIEALVDCQDWPVRRKAGWAKRVSDRFMREIVPIAMDAAASIHPVPGHAEAMRAAAERCRAEGTPAAIIAASYAASYAASDAASFASFAARIAASYAASDAASFASFASYAASYAASFASFAASYAASDAASFAERNRVLALAASIMQEEAERVNDGA